MKPRNTLLIPAILGLLAAGTACTKVTAQSQKPVGKTAAQCLAEGEAYLKTQKWEDGRKTLRLIEEYFPASPEFPKAKVLLADSYFFGSTSTYPEALVEYQSFLNYFPKHALREYALYRIGLCHFASIANAERDQTDTRKALDAFESLLRESPGTIYAVEARAKITQCWRRLAESELMVGVFYVYSMHYASAERRLKDLLETYPEYVDRERAYFYLGEALRSKRADGSWEVVQTMHKDLKERFKLQDGVVPSKQVTADYEKAAKKILADVEVQWRLEARGYYQKLVESYPKSEWAGRARDRLLEMGQSHVSEGLDG
jgi:outer membrane protein assembly factor BamD